MEYTRERYKQLFETKKILAYHGTTSSFKKFDKKYFGSSTDTGMWGQGFYFSTDKSYASTYSRGSGKLLTVYLSLKNPYIIKSKSDIPDIKVPEDTIEDFINAPENYSIEFTKFLKSKGYDGVISKLTDEIVVYEPNQIQIISEE